MAEDANDGGGGPAHDVEKQNEESGAAEDPQKAEHLIGLSSQELDEVEE